jgi:16S rRNA (uracil1498-N3)-methyltransferase
MYDMKSDLLCGKCIFLDTGSKQGNRVHIGGESFHYLRNVLRARRGTKFEAVIKDHRHTLIVTDITKTQVICNVIEYDSVKERRGLCIHVYQGMLKSKKMDFVISKLSEIGVKTLFPLKTERTVPAVDVGEEKMKRWVKIAAEGAKVSGAETVMNVCAPDFFHSVLPLPNKNRHDVILFFSTADGRAHIREALEAIEYRPGKAFHLFFGPEGGFSRQEEECAVAHHALLVSMGDFVLKAETASIVGAGFVRLYYSGIKTEK